MPARSGKKKSSNFIVQGGILAAAGIVTRLIGMIYRIPVTNIIGDKGNGYYSSAYYVYNIMLLISSYSLPLAVSKVVSARLSKNQYKNASRYFRGGLIFALISGGAVCSAVFFFADVFASLLKEPLSAIALRIFAPTLLVVAIMGVFRGYFQGMGTMVPTAVSQIIEQIINAIISIIAAKSLFDYGKKASALLRNDDLSYAYGAAGSTLGTSVGAFVALLFLVILFFLISGRLRKRMDEDETKYTEGYGEVLRIILLTVIPVILSTAIYNINDILDNYIFNSIMTAKGLGEEKTAIWGVYTGKAKLMLNVPIALSNSISASTVPALASCIASDNIRGARKRVSAAMRFTMILSFPCAVGLFILADPVISILFHGDPGPASDLLRAGSLMIIFYSTSTLSNGMLQGIGRMRVPVVNSVISLVIHVVLLVILMNRFDLGIYAVVISSIVFAACMCVLNGLGLKLAMNYRQELYTTFAVPAMAAGIMGVVIFLITLFMKDANDLATVLVSLFVGALVYCLLILRLKGVREAELYDLPMGGKIVRIAKKINLM